MSGVFRGSLRENAAAVLDGQEARLRAASTFSLGLTESHSLTSHEPERTVALLAASIRVSRLPVESK